LLKARALSPYERAVLADLKARELTLPDVTLYDPVAEAAEAMRGARYADFLKENLPRGWQWDAWHILEIARHLDALFAGDIDRLLTRMPPRHGKTETVTARAPVYSLVRTPASRELVTGYNERFARKLGRKVRNIAVAFGVEIDPEKSAADEWETVSGGGVMSRGTGSPPTGVGFQRFWIDDPIRSRKDADSEAYREAAWDWYTDDLMTRLEPGGSIALTATAWHHDDVGERAVASEPNRWTVLKLPAIDDEGKALWPERWSLEELLRRREVMRRRDGERSWEALFQQNPTPPEGAFFKPGKIGIVDVVPAGLRKARAWDAAASLDGDFTVGLRLEGPDKEGIWYVTDVERGQWEPSERDQWMRGTAEFDGPEVAGRVPEDPGSAGKSQAEAWIRLLAGFPYEKHRVSGDKQLRAGPAASQVNAGNVRMLRGDWNTAFVEELRQFPAGRHDDQVDAFADALDKLAVSSASTWDWH
jgi:predicted phage terminase large subunit-like protein